MSCTESREYCTPKSTGSRRHETPNLGSGTARDKGLYWYQKTKRCECEATWNTQCPKCRYQKQRRVSIPLKEKFDQILDRWQSLNIIEDVGDEPTDWCSKVVVTPKDSENIRARLDTTDINKYVKRTRRTIPTLQELESRLNGAKYFSHLYMNDGYMQLELAEESRKLTTFYTHGRLNHFKTLHLRVNSAVEIINERVCKVVSLEPNAISIYDNILIFGATQVEHTSYNCGGVTDWPWTWVMSHESGQPMFDDIL